MKTDVGVIVAAIRAPSSREMVQGCNSNPCWILFRHLILENVVPCSFMQKYKNNSVIVC
jgi:hypothetical protein